jgi:hypothetical protein
VRRGRRSAMPNSPRYLVISEAPGSPGQDVLLSHVQNGRPLKKGSGGKPGGAIAARPPHAGQSAAFRADVLLTNSSFCRAASSLQFDHLALALNLLPRLPAASESELVYNWPVDSGYVGCGIATERLVRWVTVFRCSERQQCSRGFW